MSAVVSVALFTLELDNRGGGGGGVLIHHNTLLCYHGQGVFSHVELA